MFSRFAQRLRGFVRDRRAQRETSHFSQPLHKPAFVAPVLATIAITVGSFYIAEKVKASRAQSGSSLGVARPSKEPETIAEMWAAFPESKRTLTALVAANVLIFLGWRVAPEMAARHFLHSPFSGKTYTIFSSFWSHEGGAHLLFNMWALWTFGNAIHQVLGREHFLAFYTSTGALSGLASHLFYAGTRQVVSGLGASGAVFGLVGFVYDKFPDAKLLLFFAIPTTAKVVIPYIAAFDLIGLTNLWNRLFNFRLGHAAHLGGLLSGVALSQTILYPPVRTQILGKVREYELKAKQVYSSMKS